jgi:hypothetical protein
MPTNKDPKLVVIFYGRFHPPHMGHKSVYDHLVKQFGNGNVYIGTSNKVDPPKSPLTFEWKKKLWTTMGVPASQLIQTKRNYNASEIISALGVDPDNTVFVVAVGQKDASRLKNGKYFHKFNKKNLAPMSELGYYTIIKNVKHKGKVVSATDVRAVLKKDELSKDDYKYLNQVIGVSRSQADNLKPLFEMRDVLSEGGQAGHMSHPFDDLQMTFSEFEDMISAALQGKLDREESPTEKIDGQNIFASMIGGRIRFARNKTQIKNKGAKSMTIKDMSIKWKDNPSVADAFVSGAKALEKALKQLSKDVQEEVFDGGRNWINIEVVWPKNKNVIDYDQEVLVLHNLTVVNDDGKNAGINKKAQSTLFDKIKGVKQGSTKVSTPIMMKVKPHTDFSVRQKYYKGKLDAFRSKMKVGPKATLEDWLRKYWKARLAVIESQFNKKLKADQRTGIVDRLAFGIKAYKLSQLKKDVADIVMYDAIKKLDSGAVDVNRQQIMPLEKLFLELGVDVLQNVEAMLAANPDKSLDSLRKDVASQIKAVRSSNNIDDITKMRDILKKIESIGGFKRLVPTEGIVFKWKGKLFKLTGIYADLNQLMGIGKYGR